MPVGSCARYPQHVCGVFDRQSAKVAKLDEFRFVGVVVGKFFECFTYRENVLRGQFPGRFNGIELDSLKLTTMLETAFAPRIVDENATHCFGSGAKEVGPTAPATGLVCIHQPDIRLMNEGGCLERLTGVLMGELGGSQLPKLIVDQWQKLLGGRQVARFDL